MLRTEDQDGVTVVRIEHGKANALDLELLQALAGQLDALAAEPYRGVVLTGQGTIFSAGVDLFRLLNGGDAYTGAFLAALDAGLRQLLVFPRPLVAAINGHAIAGGCIVAAACDWRVMAEDQGKIGVTELLVGVPFPAAALEIVRSLLAPHALAQLVLTGRTLPGRDALGLGLVDEVAPHARVLERAVGIARQLAAIPAAAFALTKRQLRQPVFDAIERTAALDGEVAHAWQRPETRAAIQAFLARTVGRTGRSK